jgi:hypothetical protein
MADEEAVSWITVHGAHVPIPEGMTAGAAIKAHFASLDRKPAKVKPVEAAVVVPKVPA